MEFSISDRNSPSPYELLFQALLLIPITHYSIALVVIFAVVLYNFVECHLIHDLLTGFRGQTVSLTFNSESPIYQGVVSKCRILHGRYLATPWLASPHLQTVFLNLFGRPPVFNYRRKIFHASDGGTIALDWLFSSDVLGGGYYMNNDILEHCQTPIMVVIPGLTSDSNSSYIKHLAYNTAKHGWDVVVSNHRGLGGVSVTSDCFYNAGWTEDIRVVVRFLHNQHPAAPLFLVGTSIGANILVKYLGEDGDDIPIAGAVSICSPWDLLIGDRFISRRLVQKFYDRALAIGLQDYAQLHQPRFSRLANWEGIKKSRSIRDFDNHATCLVGRYETVDTYYRRCSSASYLGNVSVPLLCISALDDPLCTREAIPWDECRLNKNIVLATTQHGGHLAFVEGITASGLWWVRAVNEFLGALHLSPFMHMQKKIQISELHLLSESSIDHGPYVNVGHDGMVAAASNELTRNTRVNDSPELQGTPDNRNGEMAADKQQNEQWKEGRSAPVPVASESSEQAMRNCEMDSPAANSLIRRHFDQLSRQARRSMWLLIYIAIVTSSPFAISALYFFKRKIPNVLASAMPRR
ncbi:hypothetical protein Nepgr_002150 [Nepenthes gracilis]|uniref:AB hydrolase-1 domain-containing protein n=1 Tax=Nepenthes gracilis TaxID=150966 RepID=A0AAD3P5R3_NEPGR|nr:hypothetical protein Nepgr_002150 [Nepenthes gracilis]